MAGIDVWDVLRKPRITEKGTLLAEQSKYVFEVHPRANKLQIKAAVEQAWPNVKVTAVNTMTMPGKRRRWRRHVAQQPDWKKAIVTLEPGQRIDFFEG
ncbi:MAG TPA: 50S ribosomal protein L23 [Chloroflexota bacterium]|jgi:large subunit ribosomal protein L23|nr:50S ribosomal protein L23 [Chloroflexota bacterium]